MCIRIRIKDIRGNHKDMYRFDEVCRSIGKRKSAVIAFSGGYDSSYLAEACLHSLDETCAVFVDMPIVSRRQMHEAERIAKEIGIPLMIVSLDWDEMPNVSYNDPKRCYFCKRSVYSAVRSVADELGINTCICGDNHDDLSADRPGRAAASEFGMLAPLEDLKVTRRDILRYVESKGWSDGLIKDTCLATRIPSGTPLTDELLAEVEGWESLIRDISGIRQVRFRHHGDHALIETSLEEMHQLRKSMLELNRIADRKGLSLRLDPEGYKNI